MSIAKFVTLAALASFAVADRPGGRHHGKRPSHAEAPACTIESSSSSSSSSSTSTCTQSICADYINDCGEWYGGCFPACSGYTTPSFTPPPCTVTPTNTATCTICADYVNSCGSTYGGCYDSCKTPSPSFSDPGCGPTTTTTTTPPSGPTTTGSPSCGTRCVDYINSCGQTYGGCYDDCASTTPSFTDPGCPTTTPTTTPSISTITTSTCYKCVDYINSCGQTYGGCYDDCATPSPTFTDPGCPTTTPTTTAPPIETITTSACFKCVDYINSCGQTYGGCYDDCATPSPTFEDPGCPTTTAN